MLSRKSPLSSSRSVVLPGGRSRAVPVRAMEKLLAAERVDGHLVGATGSEATQCDGLGLHHAGGVDPQLAEDDRGGCRTAAARRSRSAGSRRPRSRAWRRWPQEVFSTKRPEVAPTVPRRKILSWPLKVSVNTPRGSISKVTSADRSTSGSGHEGRVELEAAGDLDEEGLGRLDQGQRVHAAGAEVAVGVGPRARLHGHRHGARSHVVTGEQVAEGGAVDPKTEPLRASVIAVRPPEPAPARTSSSPLTVAHVQLRAADRRVAQVDPGPLGEGGGRRVLDGRPVDVLSVGPAGTGLLTLTAVPDESVQLLSIQLNPRPPPVQPRKK